MPVRCVRFWRSAIWAFWLFVLVPETSVYKYYLASGGKHKVRLSRQVLPVKPVAVSHPVNEAPDGHLRLHVFATYTPHVFAAAFLGNLVCHIRR